MREGELDDERRRILKKKKRTIRKPQAEGKIAAGGMAKQE